MSTDNTMARMSMHPPSGRPQATQVYLWNRLPRRERERGELAITSESGVT